MRLADAGGGARPEATPRLRDDRLGGPTRIGTRFDPVRAGARECLRKEISATGFVRALRSALHGEAPRL